MNRESALMACLCLSVACAGEGTRQPPAEAPHLRTQGEATQLIVDGRPFLMLAGELGNSTASNLDYLRPSPLAARAWARATLPPMIYIYSTADGRQGREARRRLIRPRLPPYPARQQSSSARTMHLMAGTWNCDVDSG